MVAASEKGSAEDDVTAQQPPLPEHRKVAAEKGDAQKHRGVIAYSTNAMEEAPQRRATSEGIATGNLQRG